MFVIYSRRSGAPFIINIVFGERKVQALVFPGCPCPSLGSLCPRFCLRLDIISVEGQVTFLRGCRHRATCHMMLNGLLQMSLRTCHGVLLCLYCVEAGLCEVACCQPSLFHTHRPLLCIHRYCRDPRWPHAHRSREDSLSAIFAPCSQSRSYFSSLFSLLSVLPVWININCLLLLVFVFQGSIFCVVLTCPVTRSVDKAGLELRDLSAFASQMLGLKVCTTMSSLTSIF